VAISDPWLERVQSVLANQRKNTKHPDMWVDTQVFSGYMDMLEKVPKIDAVIIGVPPESHGSAKPNVDIELQCAKRKIHLFIEKPLSCYPLPEVEEMYSQLADLVKEHKLVVSVGYMFRYSKAVRTMKELVEKYGPPRIFNARYNCSYTPIVKVEWWDNNKSGGPIVEQATHFCDLARYLVGDVDLDSVNAIAIFESDPLGQLNGQGKNVVEFEKTIPAERRIVRSTAASWKFKSGALGTLTHGVLLHGETYEAELEIWGDGYRLALREPYFNCHIDVRLPESEESKKIDFSKEDVYYEELDTFLEAVFDWRY